MHSLFMIGAKLLGIYFIVNGLIGAFTLVNSSVTGPFAAQLGVSCLLTLTAGTALAFFTGIVAMVLRVPETPAEQTPTLSYRPALEVGIILICLMQLLSIFPRVIAHVNDYFQQIASTRSPAELLNVEIAGVVTALVIMCFAHKIAALLERVNRHPSTP